MFSIGFGEAILLSVICMATVMPVVLVAAMVILRKPKRDDR